MIAGHRPILTAKSVLHGLGRLAVMCYGAVHFAAPATAQKIENGVAVFAALDKVTARISRLEVKLGETTSFGALKVTPRACYSRAPTEPPKTSSFVEITEKLLDGQEQRIFSGWMFAESPGLNAVEHPVFDMWLTECSGPIRPNVVQSKQVPGQKGAPAVAEPPSELPARPLRPKR